VSATSTFGGKATISTGGLEVTGATTLNNALSVVSATSTFGGKATISTGGLDVTGATLLKNNLNVNGDIQGDLTINVDGAATFGNTLSVDGVATFGNTLAVTGTSTFNDDVTIAATKKIDWGTLEITDKTLTNAGEDLTIDVGLANKVHIVGDLQVDGSFNFMGAVTQTNVNINVTDELLIESDSGSGPTMTAIQKGSNTVYDIASFHYGTSSSTPVLMVGKNNAVSVNKASATTGYSFDVAGKSQFSDKMVLLNDLSVNVNAVIGGATSTQAITMNGAAEAKSGLTVSSGKLTVSSGNTEIQALKVALTSEFTGIATFAAETQFNNIINFGSAAFIDQSEFW